MKHRLYIDEVGNHDLGVSVHTTERFLSLSGILISLDHVKDVVGPDLERLKKVYFSRHHPDSPLIFHRKELMNASHPFGELKNPDIRISFDNDLISSLASWRFRVFTVCIDKARHVDGYHYPFPPYEYCFSVLLEKVCKFLIRKGITADVMVEARNSKVDRPLQEAFKRLFTRGTVYCDWQKFCSSFTSKELKVKPKATNIPGLQVVDLIAHPSRNEILRDNGHQVVITPFADRIIKDVLQSKYDGPSWNIYGKKYLG